MSQQLQITGGAKVRDLQDVIIGTSGVLSSLAFNVANGVPKLDVNGKILVSQLPNSVMEYKGTWDASTNTPTLVNGTGNQGDVYLCNVAGTVNFGAGPITFAVGDSAIYSGTIWQRAGGATGTVTSVGLTSTGNDAITITGSPITTSGNINLGFAGTNLQYINGAGDLTNFPTLITSIGLSMPSAFSVSNSPLTSNGTIAVTGAGYPSQYIRGDGTLADFPTSGGGGSSVSYYLNGGTSQGTIGGVTYYEMSKTADTGTGVDFNKTGDGFIVAFLTDAGDPAQLNIPAGNWNYEIYASMSANGGTPEMYAELYKYDGTTFTLIATSPHEILYDGTALNLYTFAMTVPSTTLAITDRLAVKLYATNSGGKTTTVHTQDSHLCQIITTFSTGITALNGLTAQVQYFATGTSGTDFAISSSVATHTFNLPVASASNTGKLSSTDWSTFNGKVPYTGATGNVDLGLFSLKANGILAYGNGTAGGVVSFTQTGTLAGIATGVASIGSVSAGKLNIYFGDAGLEAAILDNSLLTADRTYNFPDASGILALLESTQTFSGVNTFSGLTSFTFSSGTRMDYGPYLTKGSVPTVFSGSTTNIYSDATTNNIVIRDNSSIAKLEFNNSTQTFTFPAATGTIALTSNLSSYLPLAGGIMTGSILLNNNLTISGQLFGTSSYASMIAMSPSDKVLIDNSGRGVNFGGTIGNGTYTYTLPSATGTLALTSDIPSLANYVTLNTIQTISANKTFSEFGFFDKGVLLKQNIYPSASGYNGIGAISGGFYFSLGQTTVQTLLFNTSTPYQYTFPSATGTLALTSDLGSYVPLAGNVNVTGPLGINTTGGAGTTGLTNFGTFITRSDSTQGFPRKLAISMASGTLVSIDASGNGANYITDMAFSTSTSSGLNATPAIYITGTNNRVGIKTGTPSYDLDVSGTGRFTSTLLVSGAASFDSSITLTGNGTQANNTITKLSNGYMYIDGNTNGLILENNNTSSTRIRLEAADNMQFQTASTERMRITSVGEVLMNTSSVLTAGWLCISVASDNYNAIVLRDTGTSYSSGNYYQLFTNSGNQIAGGIAHITSTTVLYGTSSDYRLKEDFKDFNGLDILSNIKFYDFKWKDEEIRMHGVIAHELQEIVPLSVTGKKDEINKEGNIVAQGVDYSKLVPILGKAIQELKAEIEQLKTLINK